MHAYGARYTEKLNRPRLALLYPKNPNFQDKLLQFRYGDDMYLDVIPFDFNNNPEIEIISIINEFFKPVEYLERENEIIGFAAEPI